MKDKCIRSAIVLMCMGLLSPAFGTEEPLTMHGVLFINVARIVQDPELPISIDGLAPVAGHPWYEARISAGTKPPPDLNPKIEVISSMPPSNLLRLPGRIIPSPYDLANFGFMPLDEKNFAYTSQWPQLFTPRDGRNTVVLALVNRGKSLLFNTNFDLEYSLDQEIVIEPTGVQTATIQLTPREDNQMIIVRLRSEATEDADAQFVEGTAKPSPSSQQPTSVIWTVANPAVGETLTFTVQAEVSNYASPTSVRHVPGLVITASRAATLAGKASGDAVSFPREFLPVAISSLTYSLSQKANWDFQRADRTLVDIREVTELVP